MPSVGATTPSPLRRSSRQQSHKSGSAGPLRHWRGLGQTWRQHYKDLGHCRIARCARPLAESAEDEHEELRSANLLFAAQAVTAAGATSGIAQKGKERDLFEYLRVARERDLPPNDDHRGESAVELAACHGLALALTRLLDEGGALRKDASESNAVHAAVRNGQHAALDILLSKRTAEASEMLLADTGSESTGRLTSTLATAILKMDVASLRLLTSCGCAWMSDLDAKLIYHDIKRFKRHKQFERLLCILYPNIPNVKHWRGALHWSFLATDRHTLNWL